MTKILVVEDEKNIQEMLEIYLASQGFEPISASDGEEALRLAHQETPQLIILDVMLPGIDGFEVCRQLRRSVKTASVPIIMLTAKATLPDKLTGFEIGADDYVTKPFDMDELVARMQTQLRHVAQALLSELTGLPGNTAIEQTIKRILNDRDGKWAILYVDIDNFKAYNDAYGFLQGNELIKAAARVIYQAVDEMASSDPENMDFVGHVGGDDFVVTTTPERVKPICEKIIRRFDAEAPLHYSPEHREQGYIITEDRKGQMVRYPIATVSIGVVTNQLRQIDTPWLVSKIAAEVKRKAKAIPGSSYYVDLRR
ncbi:MAG: response regulator [Dehalococcoidales bacterium]|nr:response regulator [Dehalococcoidales bacterium]